MWFFLASEDGPAAVEYVLVLALILVAVIGAAACAMKVLPIG
jgi:Flp pilus assembly pilin Flp